MNSNRGDDLESEESRSIESEDLLRDEVSDLFDHTLEVHDSSSKRENPRDLSATLGAGVPMLSKSELYMLSNLLCVTII